MKKIKWATILGLIIIIIATFLNWHWVWGILFLWWSILSLKIGEVYFIEPIRRRENPILFTCIILLWIALSIYYLLWSVPWLKENNHSKTKSNINIAR